MTLAEVESILDNTKHNAFPVVVSRESHFLVGCVLRRDLLLAIGKSVVTGTSFLLTLIDVLCVIMTQCLFLSFYLFLFQQEVYVASKTMSVMIRLFYSMLELVLTHQLHLP